MKKYTDVCNLVARECVDSGKNSKVLPIATAPINYMLNYYVHHAIANTDEQVKEWLNSSYMQMWCLKNHKNWKILSNKMPFIKKRIRRNLQTKSFNPADLLKMIVSCLNKGYYFDIKIDWFVLRDEVTDDAFSHGIFINGYDAEKKIFYISGYFPPKAHEVRHSTITWESFLFGFYRISKTDIRKYKLKRNCNGFSISKFKLGIESYYNSKMSLNYIFRNFTFTSLTKKDYGIKSHEYIRTNVQKVLNSNLKIERIITPLKGFKQFMEAMVIRLKYVSEKGYFSDMDNIIENYKKVAKYYDLIMILALKFQSTEDTKLLEQIIDLSKKSDDLEKATLKELISKF